MDGVGRELPHLQALHGELGHQLDRLRVVVDHHELAQLVVGLKPGQKAELNGSSAWFVRVSRRFD